MVDGAGHGNHRIVGWRGRSEHGPACVDAARSPRAENTRSSGSAERAAKSLLTDAAHADHALRALAASARCHYIRRARWATTLRRQSRRSKAAHVWCRQFEACSRPARGSAGERRSQSFSRFSWQESIASHTAPLGSAGLRAAVLGANDGIVSTASLVLGVAAGQRIARAGARGRRGWTGRGCHVDGRRRIRIGPVAGRYRGGRSRARAARTGDGPAGRAARD